MDESDTCREYVRPALETAGWDVEPRQIVEQQTFTDGRIIIPQKGKKARRQPRKRADYLLYYTLDMPLAVVEAKAVYKLPADGLQQAKTYAEILGLKFAYATNGQGIVEYDYFTGVERFLAGFPEPAELWRRWRAGQGLDDDLMAQKLLSPSDRRFRQPRYYQEIAINETLKALLREQKRMLLTMATGTGKTMVAFQICWKLWNARWRSPETGRTTGRPRILFLSDRNILVDDPILKEFSAFPENAVFKIKEGQINTGREIYFAIYQALAEDDNRAGLFRMFKPGFFDLVIVDECHRGSARADTSWRAILEYFAPAYQLGMTATPKRDDNIDTYQYFGEPLYTYSLSQGIEDGFLAPYRVYRILSNVDRDGWRPEPGELDRYGRIIPERDYSTRQYEREVALIKRTEAMAAHLTAFLKRTDRMAKTMVFCVNQEHADDMRRALANLNSDLMQAYPDYVCRVTSDEKEIGRGHLSSFQDLEKATPVILTTSHLLTTGVDAPTCQNIVIARVINSMTEFKQIIGRGTRVREEYGKSYFNILDYTGSATELFADPAFDGDPARTIEEVVDERGQVVEVEVRQQDQEAEEEVLTASEKQRREVRERGKYYYDKGEIQVVTEAIYDLDPEQNRLRLIKLIDATAQRMRSIYPDSTALRVQWADVEQRKAILELLKTYGLELGNLLTAINQPEADPFDALCSILFSIPPCTRQERATRARQELDRAFHDYRAEARKILDVLLENYTAYGLEELTLPAALEAPALATYGNLPEIALLFGSAEKLRTAVTQLQALLYAA